MSDEKVYLEMSMEDGAIYRGCVEEGEPAGWGAMTFPDRRVYLGYFSEGEPAAGGACAVLFPDKRVRIWLGASHGGQAFASELLPDGVFRAGAIGDWTKDPLPLKESDAMIHHNGVMIFPDGRVYVGEFEDGKVGHGRPPAGGLFTAHWAQGPFRYGNNPHGGDGVMLFPDGRVYVGEFSDGTPDGYGSMISPGGEVCTGNFCDGDPEAALADSASEADIIRDDRTEDSGGYLAQSAKQSARSRFSAEGLKAHRERLGLSADNYGRLIGVSGLSIYNWEGGKAKPRESSIAALASIRGIGKREAAKRLEALAKEKTEEY